MTYTDFVEKARENNQIFNDWWNKQHKNPFASRNIEEMSPPPETLSLWERLHGLVNSGAQFGEEMLRRISEFNPTPFPRISTEEYAQSPTAQGVRGIQEKLKTPEWMPQVPGVIEGKTMPEYLASGVGLATMAGGVPAVGMVRAGKGAKLPKGKIPEPQPIVSEVPKTATAGGKPPIEPPKPPAPAGTPEDIDNALNRLGDWIAGSESKEAFASQREIWAKERVSRSAKFAELLEKEKATGADAKTVIERATAAFKNAYPRIGTGLDLPQEIQDAAYQKIIKVIAEDADIPPVMKSFEIASTKTALDNALAGKPIPDIPGTKGGSAKTRLLRVFQDNPTIKKIIENPDEVQRLLLESKASSAELDQAAYEYLKNLPTLGQRAGLGIEEPLLTATKQGMVAEKPIAEFAGIGKTSEQIERETIGLKLDLATKPSVLSEVNIPPEPLLKPPPQKLFPETPIEKFAGTAKTKAQIDQETLDLTLELLGKPQALPEVNVPPDKLLKQFSMLPPDKRTQVINTLKTVGVNIIDAIGIPKAVKFAIDMSFMGRQLGTSGARHPISWFKTWKPYFNAMRSEKVAMSLDNMIKTAPDRMDAVSKLGLDLYDISKGATYWNRPETMASKIAERYIPGIRMSNRGAAVALNYFITDVGKQSVKVLGKMGARQEEYKAMGALLNELVGRGQMPVWLRGTAGDILNKLLSSPRFLVSKFEWPVKLVSSSKAVRQEAWSTLGAWLGVNAGIMGLAKASGVADLEGDPRSSEVLKIRIGDKRIDLWSGWAQLIRAAAQLAPYVDEATGKVDWTMGSRITRDGKLVPMSRQDVINRFLQSKESPGIGAMVTLFTGKNYVGENIDFSTPGGWGNWFKETFAPASFEEMADAYFVEGAGSSLLSSIGLGGIGVSTYNSKERIVQGLTDIYPKLGQPDIEGLQKRLARATTPEMKEYIQKRGMLTTVTDLAEAIDAGLGDMDIADITRMGLPAIVANRKEALDYFREYDNTTPDKREKLRAKNPELDAALAFWGRTETTQTTQAANLLRTMATNFGIPTAAIPALSKKSTSSVGWPSLGGSFSISPARRQRLTSTSSLAQRKLARRQRIASR